MGPALSAFFKAYGPIILEAMRPYIMPLIREVAREIIIRFSTDPVYRAKVEQIAIRHNEAKTDAEKAAVMAEFDRLD